MSKINQPTVLVRRSDGTTVRMTLDELKEMKKNGGNSAGVVKKNTATKVSVDAEKKEVRKKTHKKNSPKPRKSIVNNLNNKKKDNQQMKKWEGEDHKSLLDEEFHKDTPTLVKEGEHILARTAPVKKVFTNEAEYESHKNSNKKSMVKPWDKKERVDRVKRPANVPGIRLKDSPTLPKKKPWTPPVMPKPTSLAPKPAMQDVFAPKKTSASKRVKRQSVGPVDELRNFSLQDFRRLGNNLEDSVVKLKEKFGYLKKDSYLMFMEGVEAWYNSPLYRSYQEIISKSLKTKTSVESILTGTRGEGDIKLEEFKAILKLNQSL